MEHWYTCHGLLIRSELALPELRQANPGETALSIVQGHLPPGRPGRQVEEQLATLRIPGVANLRIAEGRQITVELAPRATVEQVRPYLLGTGLAAIVHQRGLLPLHASGLLMDAQGVVLAGVKGSGKSTLAAYGLSSGYHPLCDDVAVIRFSPAPEIVAGPGRLWLNDDSLEQVGRRPSCAINKGLKRGLDFEARGAYSMSKIFILDPKSSQCVRLRGLEALGALHKCTFRKGFIPARGHVERLCHLCRHVPVYRLGRSEVWSLSDLLTQAIRT